MISDTMWEIIGWQCELSKVQFPLTHPGGLIIEMWSSCLELFQGPKGFPSCNTSSVKGTKSIVAFTVIYCFRSVFLAPILAVSLTSRAIITWQIASELTFTLSVFSEGFRGAMLMKREVSSKPRHLHLSSTFHTQGNSMCLVLATTKQL